METTTNSLQKLIEERASKKLKAEIATLFNTFSKSKFINSNDKIIQIQTANVVKGEIKWEVKSLRSVFMFSDLDKKLYDLWLSDYIQEETKSFVEQVDKLQEQIDDLKQQTDELNNQSRN